MLFSLPVDGTYSLHISHASLPFRLRSWAYDAASSPTKRASNGCSLASGRWDLISAIGIALFARCAAQGGLARNPGAGKRSTGAFFVPPFKSLRAYNQTKRASIGCSFCLVRSMGLEPIRSPIRPSNVRVCRFRHDRKTTPLARQKQLYWLHRRLST